MCSILYVVKNAACATKVPRLHPHFKYYTLSKRSSVCVAARRKGVLCGRIVAFKKYVKQAAKPNKKQTKK